MIQSDLEAVLLVLSYEQLRLRPYDDGVGVLTTGWGHRILKDEKHLRAEITRETANSLFLADFELHEAAVLGTLNRELSPLQLGACSSLCFNIGPTAFAGSSVARFINSGHFEKVPDAFRMWNKGKVRGKLQVMKGLEDRREAEVRLWKRGALAT